MISVSQPDKNPISNKLPFKISFNKKDQQPRALALPPASMAPSTFPA